MVTDIPMTFSAHIHLIQWPEQFHNSGYCFYFTDNVREDQRFMLQPSINTQSLVHLEFKFMSHALSYALSTTISCFLPAIGSGQMCVETYWVNSNFERIPRFHRDFFFFSSLFLLKLKIGMWIKSRLGPSNAGNFWSVIGKIEIRP